MHAVRTRISKTEISQVVEHDLLSQMYIISICIRDTNVSMISLKNSKWHRLIVKQSYKLFIKLPITSFRLIY